jgi:hypothetical protein
MKYYYEKTNDEQCKEDYTSMNSPQLENECNKVKKYFGKDTKCSNICKVNLIEMIDSLTNLTSDQKRPIYGPIHNIDAYYRNKNLPYYLFVIYSSTFIKNAKNLISSSVVDQSDKDKIKIMIDYMNDKIENYSNYFAGNIDINIKEEKFKLIIENNHLKKEIDTITLRSQEYLQDIEEDNKFKKGQDIIRDRIEFYNKWLHKLKKTTLIVHFILVFIVIGMLVYKLS